MRYPLDNLKARAGWRRAAFAIGAALFLLAVAPLHAQTNFSINWYSIDGGGGVSTGGTFTVTGTVGQPDAGKMSGGAYTLDGGFWGIFALVQTPGAPTLRIANTLTNSVLVLWPSPSTGWRLQQNTNIGTTNWTDVAQIPSDDGNTKSVAVSPPSGRRFYRLITP